LLPWRLHRRDFAAAPVWRSPEQDVASFVPEARKRAYLSKYLNYLFISRSRILMRKSADQILSSILSLYAIELSSLNQHACALRCPDRLLLGAFMLTSR
jgi:hypothetical protein